MKYPKSTMTESRLVVTQGWNEEVQEWEVITIRYKVSFLSNKNVLKLDYENSHTTL